ncbi:STAS domain-containing protein [Streptomyces sp. CRN 30]|uniref:STAS domain-containing protein n=1 Tax=Streptomyces sp. CRN 30 TaxID=3075613 RepID=UPI002A82F28E|nr:STAS domain-containing protein [Streptomyces sp. CRN 30]
MQWSELVPDLRFALTRGEEQSTLYLAGELDAAAALTLFRALPLPDICAGRVVLDLSRVTWCDGAGVDVLLALYYQAAATGGQLVLKSAHSAVLRALARHGEEAAVELARACAARMRAGHHPDQRLLQQAMGMALRLTGSTLGTAQVWDAQARTLRIVTQRGFPRDVVSFFETVNVGECSCGTAALNHSPVVVEEVRGHPSYAGTPAADVLGSVPVGAVISLPVITPESHLIGMISVHHQQPSRWPAEQRRRLHTLAHATGQLAHHPA